MSAMTARHPRQHRRRPAGVARLAIVSTYPPRHCGLSSFASDLYTAVTLPGTGVEATVCAMDRTGLSYPPEVTAVIAEANQADYRRAARSLHARGTDVVLIQHEYGIFGGLHGSHVLALTDELTLLGVPYIVTLHTVPSRPDMSQARVLAALCHAAATVTVFSASAVRLAQSQHLVPHGRISVVPHGTPQWPVVGRQVAELARACALSPAVRNRAG